PRQRDARVDAEFAVDALHVLAHCVAAQMQPLADLAIRETVHDERRDFTLARRQRKERPCGPLGTLPVELEHRDQRSALARQPARIPVQPAGAPVDELDIDVTGEADATLTGGRDQPVQPFLPSLKLRQQPPSSLVEAKLERLRIADHDRTPRKLERGPRPLELPPEILPRADTLDRDTDQAAESLPPSEPHPRNSLDPVRWSRN